MTISDALRAIVRAQAGNRCGYCLARQEYVPWTLEMAFVFSRGLEDEPLEHMPDLAGEMNGQYFFHSRMGQRF
jgi:hypothetical protein